VGNFALVEIGQRLDLTVAASALVATDPLSRLALTFVASGLLRRRRSINKICREAGQGRSGRQIKAVSLCLLLSIVADKFLVQSLLGAIR